MMVATSPAGLILAGATATTPGVPAIAPCSFWTATLPPPGMGATTTPCLAASLAGLGSFATTSSGPLKPSPKPRASSS